MGGTFSGERKPDTASTSSTNHATARPAVVPVAATLGYNYPDLTSYSSRTTAKPSRTAASTTNATARKTVGGDSYSSHSTGATASTVRPATITQARTVASSSTYSSASTVSPSTSTSAKPQASAYSTTAATARPAPIIGYTTAPSFPSASNAHQTSSEIRPTTSTELHAPPAIPKSAYWTEAESNQPAQYNVELRQLVAKRAHELIKHRQDEEQKIQKEAEEARLARIRAQVEQVRGSRPIISTPASTQHTVAAPAEHNRETPEEERQREAAEARLARIRAQVERVRGIRHTPAATTQPAKATVSAPAEHQQFVSDAAELKAARIKSQLAFEAEYGIRSIVNYPANPRDASDAYLARLPTTSTTVTPKPAPAPKPVAVTRPFVQVPQPAVPKKKKKATIVKKTAQKPPSPTSSDAFEDEFSRMNLNDSSDDRASNSPTYSTDGEFRYGLHSYVVDHSAPDYFDQEYLSGLSVGDDDSDEVAPKMVPIYTLAVTPQRVCVFEPGREKFIEVKQAHIQCHVIEEQIYHATSITRDSAHGWTQPTELTRMQYSNRAAFSFGSASSYRELIVPALLLGSRVRDYEQRCATVNSIGPLVLSMPAQNRRLKVLKLKTSSGETFSIDVKWVQKKDEDKRWIVYCHPPKEGQHLPVEVRNGALLEIQEINTQQPRVTFALLNKYSNPRAPIDNWPLLSCIYGAQSKIDYPSVGYLNPFIPLAKNAGSVQLNPEQVEAVSRYNCESCPAFVVESPPGSGKTMTAAAMAVSYKRGGVQLFLSTANVPVINMALALAKLDYGSLKAVHLISSEREELMTEETRSPFSVLSLAKAQAKLVEKIEQLERELEHAPNEEEKEKLKNAIRKTCGPVMDDKYDVYFGTVDMMLGNLFKKGQRNKVNVTQKQLANEVRRVVVDEASQLTESALNALILCFPKAQIVLIGDSKQLPPFRYAREDLVSEMAARSALEVIKAKMNLPVIKLSHVYRASPRLMAHYSDVFYGGALVSGKSETAKNLLSCFGARSGGYRTLFWQTKGYQKQSGTSKFNDGEITTLKYLLNILRNSGHDEKYVMIISYYEAQRRKVEEELEKKGWEGYEVLTVDSAQGREKKIVIVMTTRTSVPTDSGAFFSCPLRCNVAVSRHQEALIVLGHKAIASAPNWSKVLSTKYFRHVPPYSG